MLFAPKRKTKNLRLGEPDESFFSLLPRYVFNVGFRESGFQKVVARASRPCVGCTIRTGGTPVPLPSLRFSPRSCLAGKEGAWLRPPVRNQPHLDRILE